MGIDNRVVGAAITELRMRAGMTQQQLAAGLNVSHQAVSKWEKGGGYIGVERRAEGEPFEYYIGMLTPENTPVPDGFVSIDFKDLSLGTCWIYGKCVTIEKRMKFTIQVLANRNLLKSVWKYGKMKMVQFGHLKIACVPVIPHPMKTEI